MDLPLVIRQRLEQLGREQRDLAVAAQVTESYISQLLTRRKAPPAPERTDIYGKIEEFLKFRKGELTKLAEQQRHEALKRKLADPPAPLFKEVRELVLRKCKPDKQKQIAAILRSSLSVNSNSWSRRNFWMWSSKSPDKNWKVKTGSA